MDLFHPLFLALCEGQENSYAKPFEFSKGLVKVQNPVLYFKINLLLFVKSFLKKYK